VLLGKHDDEYVVVKLEENGELNVLLKGAYDDELRTVKLDADGRLSAFVIDSVDAWSQMLSCGNAELAARMGSMITYDRRGQHVYTEQFEKGWGAWAGIGGGTGNAQVLDPEYAVGGGYALKLVGGSDGTNLAHAVAYLPVLPVGVWGFALRFSIYDYVDTLRVSIEREDGAHRHFAKVMFDDADDTVYFRHGDHYYEEAIAPANFERNPRAFNYLKLVADTASDQYVRLLFNEHEVDLSAYPIEILNSVTQPKVVLRIKVYSRDANNDTAWIDDVAVTVNEP